MPGPIQFSFAGSVDPSGNAIAPPPGVRLVDENGIEPEDEDEEPTQVRVAVRTGAKPQKGKAAVAVTSKNLLQLAKDRLKELETEIRALKSLEKERNELQRLVAAAEGPAKPKPTKKKSAPTAHSGA